MAKIIFRSPFVTNRDRADAKKLIEVSDKLYAASEVWHEHGNATNRRILLIESIKLLESAARRLGFRNTNDLSEYRKRHGRI